MAGLDQPRPHPATPTGLTTISVPAITVQATIVGVGLQANGPLQSPPQQGVCKST